MTNFKILTRKELKEYLSICRTKGDIEKLNPNHICRTKLYENGFYYDNCAAILSPAIYMQLYGLTTTETYYQLKHINNAYFGTDDPIQDQYTIEHGFYVEEITKRYSISLEVYYYEDMITRYLLTDEQLCFSGIKKINPRLKENFPKMPREIQEIILDFAKNVRPVINSMHYGIRFTNMKLKNRGK